MFKNIDIESGEEIPGSHNSGIHRGCNTEVLPLEGVHWVGGGGWQPTGAANHCCREAVPWRALTIHASWLAGRGTPGRAPPSWSGWSKRGLQDNYENAEG